MLNKTLILISLFSFPYLNLFNYGSSNYNKFIAPQTNNYEVIEFPPTKTDNTTYFTINDFDVGYIGAETNYTFSVTYNALQVGYSYLAQYEYVSNLGYYRIGAKDSYTCKTTTTRKVSFTISTIKLFDGEVDFRITIKCFKKINGVSVIFESNIISFSAVNQMGKVTSNTPTIHLPYYFSFNGSTNTAKSYYDEVTFINQKENYLDYLYFRLKPENILLSYVGEPILSDFRLVILNNNGSFDNCINEKETNEPYFLLTPNYLTVNTCNLLYKGKNEGGSLDLYLNPLNGLMSNEYSSDEYSMKVKNIYFPRNSSYVYEYLNCQLKVLGYGTNLTIITWNFKLIFNGNTIDDYINSSIYFGEISDSDSLEEIIIP